jgi:hypothetical protein
MLTKMTDADWMTVLRVFKASRSRPDKGRDDKIPADPFFTGQRDRLVALAARYALITQTAPPSGSMCLPRCSPRAREPGSVEMTSVGACIEKPRL